MIAVVPASTTRMRTRSIGCPYQNPPPARKVRSAGCPPAEVSLLRAVVEGQASPNWPADHLASLQILEDNCEK
ncbi:hypothetical protein QYF36_015376 [Acer negundo]|nr:hypothetical protein QYF36_015376 [Acer negundo]